MEYSPAVYETCQAPQHTQSTATNSPNHHTTTPHPSDRKRPRPALDYILAKETNGDTTSPNTQQPISIFEKPHASKRPKNSHLNPHTSATPKCTPTNNPSCIRTPKHNHNRRLQQPDTSTQVNHLTTHTPPANSLRREHHYTTH